MKTVSITISLLCLFLSIQLIAQSNTSCDCKADLIFMDSKIEKMPSYRKQVKGNQQHPYFKKKKELLNAAEAPVTLLECYQMLNALVATIKDNHAWVKQTGEVIEYARLSDSLWITAYRKGEAFQNHPRINKDISSLERALATKPISEIEGIYNYKDVMTLGIVKSEKDDHYTGFVLNTSLPNWDVGQVVMYLQSTSESQYQITRYGLVDKQLRFVPDMLYFDGTLLGYFKKKGAHGFTMVASDEIFEFKQLNATTQYLYFKHFSRTNENIPKFKAFLERMKRQLNAPNVIVDLRNNGGGAEKLSDPFLKLLKSKNVYILTNFYTGSNGEQFTLKLKKQGAVHLGQRTNGTIAYGTNYGTTFTLPSGHFKFRPTDMNFHKYIEYERVGVHPDQPLTFDKDWIEQTLQIISNAKE